MNAATTIECPRCDGKGIIEAFRHVADGRCFLCLGACRICIDRISALRDDHYTLGYTVGNTYKAADGSGDTITQPERMWIHGQSKNGTVWTFFRDVTDVNRAELRAIWSRFAKLPHEKIIFDANNNRTYTPVAN